MGPAALAITSTTSFAVAHGRNTGPFGPGASRPDSASNSSRNRTVAVADSVNVLRSRSHHVPTAHVDFRCRTSFARTRTHRGQQFNLESAMGNDHEWLFMLYMSGDNNLSSEMIRALKDIQDEDVPSGIKMTILYDALSPCCPTYVYDVNGASSMGPAGAKEVDPSLIPQLPLTRALGKASKVYEWIENSSNRQTLRTFIEWGVAVHPSKYRMLILSGHGSGAVGDFLPDDHPENSPDGSLSIPALHDALEEAGTNLNPAGREQKTIDILGMDSCLMSMAEVAYEVRNSVEFLVGSEGFVQNAGWPYGFLLKKLKERAGGQSTDSKVTPEQMAGCIVEDYIEYYREYLPANVSVDMAACELARLGRRHESSDACSLRSKVMTLTRLLTGELQKCPPDEIDPPVNTLVRDAVTLAHWRAQSYKFEQYTDLWDFCEELRRLTQLSPELEGISVAAAEVKKAIDEVVGRKDGREGRQDYEGIEFQHSHGLSVYFPWSRSASVSVPFDEEPYQQLAFAAESGWGDFLTAYLGSTRRERRTIKGVGRHTPPIFGLDSADAMKKHHRLHPAHRNAPNSGRNAPNSGRNAPNSGRNAPNSGRNAPNSGRMLDLLVDTLRASMKNPPQSVYLRPLRELRQEGRDPLSTKSDGKSAPACSNHGELAEHHGATVMPGAR
jgi:Clostripain family